MKKIVAWLLVLTMTVAISIGATLAYLTDTDEDVNVMTLGNVKIDQLEYERIDDETANDNAQVQEFHDNKPLYPAVTENGFDYTPGDTYVDWEQIGKEKHTSDIWNPEKINNELDKMVFVKNKGASDAYVRTIFAFEAGRYATVDEFKSMMHLNLNEDDFTWEWFGDLVTIGESHYFIATATYNKVLPPNALTEISLSQLALDKTATNEDVEAFGETYQILVKSQAIQVAGFEDPVTALNEGFGEISTAPEAVNLPWENDNPTKGINMVTAVNTYKGKSITSKVQSVVYGKNADYPEIADRNKGVLVDVEQDVPVYAYYVENNGRYQIYMLADDTIYLPKDATKMFNGMSNLTTVVVDNLSTERTTSLRGTFQNCNRLTELDVSDWDTSKVTDMAALFNNCNALNLIGYENWDTSSLQNALYLFQNTQKMTRLDLSGWDVSKLTTAEYMFYGCTNLTSVDTTGWELSDLNSAVCMFYGCKNLSEIKGIEGWGLGNATDLHHMFYQCSKLDNVDISDWNVSRVKDFRYLFAHASSLSELDLSDWDVSSAQNMTHMFYNCPNLEKLNAAGWNTGKVTDFSHMFASASQNVGNIKLKELNISGWNTESATTMVSMFYGCGSLTELDLSDWDVSNVQNMSHMFADCFLLSDLNLADWDTSSLEIMDCMFNDCDSLITLDVSMLETDRVKEFSQVFDDCDSLTEIIGLSNWNTANGCTFEEMFQGCEKLTELDLSSFDTGNARDRYPGYADTYDAFVGMFSNMTSLEKLVLGENFDFDGNGSVTVMASLPNPVAREGFVAKWRNVETGEIYPASEIPEGVAAVYEAYYEAISAA